MKDQKEKHVYLAQLKCPNGHCLYSTAGEFEDPFDARRVLAAEVRAGLKELMDQDRLIDYSCGVCRADPRTLAIEVSITAFRTLEEATPTLIKMSQQQQEAVETARRAARN